MANLDFSQIKEVVIPEGKVSRIEIDGAVVWKDGYTNLVPLSINADGSIYNNGLGYKNGYRIRSNGAEGTNSNTACTGFIPVSGGDVIRISGCNYTYAQNGNAINVSDGSFANIGQFTMLPAQYGIFASGYTAYSYGSVVQESDGIWKWVVPPAASGVAYIRISAYDNVNGSPGARLIVTVNEEIT